MTDDPKRGAALAVVAALFAAGFLIAFQAAARSGPRDAVVLAMLVCAMAFNIGLTAARWRGFERPGRTWTTTVLALAVMTVAGNIGVAGALGRLDAGLTSTILQTQVFFVGVGGRVFLGERVTLRFVAGAALAVGGFAVLGVPDASAAAVDPGGVGFALLGSVSFAAMLVWTRGVILRIEPVSVNAVRLVIAVAALACLPGQWHALAGLSARAWAFAAIAAACGPFASRLCLMFAVRYISASRTKLLSLLSPVFAFALAFAVYGAIPLHRELLGGVLILMGVVVPTLERKRATSTA